MIKSLERLNDLKFNKMSRNSEFKFQVHLSSTKPMFQYMTLSEDAKKVKIYRPSVIRLKKWVLRKKEVGYSRALLH